MSKKFDGVVEKYKNVCLFCGKPIQVLCGTPIIYLGGCCYGKMTKNVMYVFPRKAHLGCWLRKNNLKIVEVKK